jgi:hypothetical protein
MGCRDCGLRFTLKPIDVAQALWDWAENTASETSGFKQTVAYNIAEQTLIRPDQSREERERIVSRFRERLMPSD